MKNFFCFILLFWCLSFKLFGQNSLAFDKEKFFNFLQNQDYQAAANYLINIYGENVSDAKTATQIGYCFLMAGNTASAAHYYQIAYQLQPKNLTVLFSLANLNVKRGNLNQAKNYYESILKIDSTNFNACKQLASFYSKGDSLKLIYLQKANQINQQDGDVANDYASILSFRKNYNKAYQVLLVAIQADSSNYLLQKSKLEIVLRLKKYQEVIQTGEKLMASVDDAAVLLIVGEACYKAKQYQKCINYFTKCEQQNIQTESTLYYLSICYRELKNYPQAILYAKKTINEAISSNTASYYALLGMLHQENKSPQAAISAYQKGLSFKNNTDLYYRLGILYDQINLSKKLAKKYYNKYLEAKPNAIKDSLEINYVKSRLKQLYL